MCGIGGIIYLDGKPVMKADLKKMADVIAHRGPDGEGFFTDGNLGFAHRRLAIFDLSDAGVQPMTQFGLTIIFNGAVYNFPELKKELEEAGFFFSTQTDTEVIMAAYRHWGKDCVKRFKGMWAFAIYDTARRELFLSRDRFGEKPLYYSHSAKQFVFASEIKALKPFLPQLTPNAKQLAAAQVFELYEHPVETTCLEIFKLPAACNLTISLSDGAATITTYYKPERHDRYVHLSPQEACEELHVLLRQSVSIRLRSDVAIGTCLSGGVDSGLIAAVASSLLPPHTFTSVTAGTSVESLDETHAAFNTARALGLKSFSVGFSPKQLLPLHGDVSAHQEGMIAGLSVVMQHELFRFAKSKGLKVLLDGQGADELFLGYPRHISQLYLNKLIAIKKASTAHGLSYPESLKLVVYHANARLKALRQYLKHKTAYRKAGNLEAINMAYDEMVSRNSSATQSLFHFQVNELYYRSLPSLLRFEDMNAMRFGIETRLPYLDEAIVEFALNMPMEMHTHPGFTKPMLRTIFGNYASQVKFSPRKIGFDPGA